MIFGGCNYKIDGFFPRLDGTSYGKWNFSVGLRKEFAQRAFEREISQEVYERVNKETEIITRKIRVLGSMGSHYYEFTKNNRGNLTLLLKSCNVPGNATYISLEGIDLLEGLKIKDEYDKYLIFNPHNIDTIVQAAALLSNWIRWYDCAEATLIS